MSTTVPIFDAKGVAVGEATLPSVLFGYSPEIVHQKKGLLHEVVRGIRASLRQGTHSTKTRGEVSGGGRKPFRQKGTGNARQGSSREPQHRGGGVVFGPKPRSHDIKVNSKKYAQAINLAFSDRANNSNILILDNWGSSETPSTKLAQRILKRNQVDRSHRNLLIVAQNDQRARLSLRNLSNTKVVFPLQANAYDVLSSQKIIFDVKSFIELTGDEKLVKLSESPNQTSKPKSTTDSKSTIGSSKSKSTTDTKSTVGSSKPKSTRSSKISASPSTDKSATREKAANSSSKTTQTKSIAEPKTTANSSENATKVKPAATNAKTKTSARTPKAKATATDAAPAKRASSKKVETNDQ
ncbi:MAG: 50S ribosomal protein L4 [Bifidobacteriaceae bacterium]|jgi:large subunit ribosomal protein L4|nr:50S ribosomal protein L4 [Bifidobacteriaceae bacterium]